MVPLPRGAQQLHSFVPTPVGAQVTNFAHLRKRRSLAHTVLHKGRMLTPELPQRPAELVYDRRTSARIALDAPALIDAFHAWRKCSVKSVSSTGVSVDTDWKLEIGTRVDVYFEIPRAVAVEAHAEVVRSAEHELAFRFIDLPADVASAVESYVRLNLSDSLPSFAVVC